MIAVVFDPVIVIERVKEASGLIVTVLVVDMPVTPAMVIGNVSEVEYNVSINENITGPETPRAVKSITAFVRVVKFGVTCDAPTAYVPDIGPKITLLPLGAPPVGVLTLPPTVAFTNSPSIKLPATAAADTSYASQK